MMKKAKALTKRKVDDFVRSNDEITLLDIEPLDEEVVSFGQELAIEGIETMASIPTPYETTVDDLILDSDATLDGLIPAQNAGETETVHEKRSFWQTFKRQVVEEEVKIESTPVEVEKEESLVMSYNAKSNGYENGSAAVVSATMVIKGDVELATSLVCSGKVVGNVNCKESVEFKKGGSIEGNINAVSADFVGGDVKGNVTCEDRVMIDEETVVVGDLNAKDIVISGKVTGEVKASGSVKLMHSANIKGDLYAASVSIEAGARLEGKFVVSSAE